MTLRKPVTDLTHQTTDCQGSASNSNKTCSRQPMASMTWLTWVAAPSEHHCQQKERIATIGRRVFNKRWSLHWCGWYPKPQRRKKTERHKYCQTKISSSCNDLFLRFFWKLIIVVTLGWPAASSWLAYRSTNSLHLSTSKVCPRCFSSILPPKLAPQIR